MSDPSLRSIDIATQEDVVRARQVGRDLARDLGFRTADQARLATAISELTRNVLKYAGGGVCEIVTDRQHEVGTIHVSVVDHGPGIADIEMAMADGFTTGGGLGAGLPGTKRLVDEFDIASVPGETKIDITMSRRIG